MKQPWKWKKNRRLTKAFNTSSKTKLKLTFPAVEGTEETAHEFIGKQTNKQTTLCATHGRTTRDEVCTKRLLILPSDLTICFVYLLSTHRIVLAFILYLFLSSFEIVSRMFVCMCLCGAQLVWLFVCVLVCAESFWLTLCVSVAVYIWCISEYNI